MVFSVHALAAAALLLAPVGPGSLDRDFGAHGKAYADFGAGKRVEVATDVAVTGSGKVVASGVLAAGGDTRWAVARWTTRGRLDPRFSDDGRAVTRIGAQDVARAVVLRGSGRMLVGGSSDGRFALVAYRSDGSLDPAWAGDGVATTEIPAGDGVVLDLRLLDDGSVLAGGWAGDALAVAHYTATGDLIDVVTSAQPFGGDVFDVEVQPDGGLLATGAGDPDEDGIGGLRTMKVDPAGLPDPAFGTAGTVTTYVTDSESARGQVVTARSDGTILVGGSALGPGDYRYQVVARYLADGSLDTSFAGGRGYTHDLLDYSSEVADLDVQGDGRIVTSGWAAGDKPYRVAVSRYTTAGVLDPSFNGHGYRTIAYGVGTPTTPSSTSYGEAVTLADHRIHVVGAVIDGPRRGDRSFIALRLRR